mgnify:CR=1 FL=1
MSDTVEDLMDQFCPVVTLYKVNFRSQTSYDIVSSKHRCSPISPARGLYGIGRLNEASKLIRVDSLDCLFKSGWRSTEEGAWRVVLDKLKSTTHDTLERMTSDKQTLDICFSEMAYVESIIHKS